ncbi:hypothetical protein ACH4PR_46030 [Streptomyces mirabilis]|uniref:hypothetical protein n=1 Tax=Streptomyces mirabilis TaxID=68239 RepID=UPI0037B0F146
MSVSHFVTRRTTKSVISRTTKAARPEAESDRYHAWQLLFTPQRPKDWSGTREAVPGLLPPSGHLGDIAAKYDRIHGCLLAGLTEDLTETELLAGLLVVRALRDKLLEDEARLIAAARRRKITWVRIGRALEVRSRQAAERRFLQLRTDIDDLHGSPLTQHERVAYARDQRERHAERSWTIEHASRIRALAQRLLAFDDLQERADRSPRALQEHRTGVREAQLAGSAPPALARSPWPDRLREAVTDDSALQKTPPVQSASDLDGSRLKATRVASSIHQLFGLVIHAADPGSVDLADSPDLAAAIASLRQQAEDDAVKTQTLPTSHSMD